MVEKSLDDKSEKKAPRKTDFEIIRDVEGVTSWAPPSMGNTGRVVQSAIKEKKRPRNESIENVPSSKRPAPLTADALQKMAAEAREEGFAEGRSEGLENGHTEGYNKGFDAGNKKAYQETRTKLEAERAKLAAIAEELLLPMQLQQSDLETVLVDLVLNLTKKVLHSEINTDPALLFNVITQAVGELPVGAKNIKVFLNQEDSELMAGLAEDRADIGKWPIEIDNALASGGCRIESSESLIDFDITRRILKYFDEAKETDDDWEEDYEPLIEKSDYVMAPVPATKGEASLPEKGVVSEPDESDALNVSTEVGLEGDIGEQTSKEKGTENAKTVSSESAREQASPAFNKTIDHSQGSAQPPSDDHSQLQSNDISDNSDEAKE